MEQSLRTSVHTDVLALVKMITIGQVFVYDVTDIANASSKIPITLNFPELNICISIDVVFLPPANTTLTRYDCIYVIDVSMLKNVALYQGASLSEAILLPPYVKPRTIRTTEQAFEPVFIMLLNELFN